MPISTISDGLNADNLKDYVLSWAVLLILNLYSFVSTILNELLPVTPLIFQVLLYCLTLVSTYITVQYAIERKRFKKEERRNLEMKNELLKLEVEERKGETYASE